MVGGGLLCAGMAGARAAAPLHHPTGNQVTLAWPRDPNIDEPIVRVWLFEGLTRLAADGRVEPCLAESWTFDGPERVVFALRPGARFHDGAPFDARAVLDGFNAVGGVEGVRAIAAPDLGTIVMTLDRPTPRLLARLAVIRFARGAIGTGPWLLASREPDESARFTPNQRHWGRAPRIDRLIVRVEPSPERRVLALEAGEADLLFGADTIPAEAFLALRASGLYRAAVSPPLGTRRIILNEALPPTDAPAFRAALRAGVDRARLARVFGGLEEAADGPGFAPARALDTLARHGEIPPLDFIFDRDDAVAPALARALASALTDLAVPVRLIGDTADATTDRLRAGRFHLAFQAAPENTPAPTDANGFLPVTRARNLALLRRGIEGFGFRALAEDVPVDLLHT